MKKGFIYTLCPSVVPTTDSGRSKSCLTSSDDAVCADGGHGQTCNGSDHTAEKDDHYSQTCNGHA